MAASKKELKLGVGLRMCSLGLRVSELSPMHQGHSRGGDHYGGAAATQLGLHATIGRDATCMEP